MMASTNHSYQAPLDVRHTNMQPYQGAVGYPNNGAAVYPYGVAGNQPAQAGYQPAPVGYQPAPASYQPAPPNYQPAPPNYQPAPASYAPAVGGNPAMVLHVSSTGSRYQPQINVTFWDKQTTAFVAVTHSHFSSAPDIELYRGVVGGPRVGSASYHAFSSATDIKLFNASCQSVTLAKAGPLSRTHSVVLDGQTYSWSDHHTGMFGSGGLKMENQHGKVFAYFTRSKELSQWGSIEIVVHGLSDSMVEGIVLTAIAMAEKARRTKNHSKTSSSAVDSFGAVFGGSDGGGGSFGGSSGGSSGGDGGGGGSSSGGGDGGGGGGGC